MACETDLVALTELAYAAGTDATRWPVFLRRLGQSLEATCGVFLVQDVESHSGSYTVSYGVEACDLLDYAQYYSRHNVWTNLSADSLVPGAVTPTEAVCSVRDLVKTEFYNDYLRRYDVRHGIGATILRQGSLTATVSVVRGSGAFDAKAGRLLALLMPHLQRAIETHQRLAATRLEEQALLEALDRLAFGVMLMDDRARPIFVNIEGRRLLSTRDGLYVEGGLLTATRPGDTQTLRALVRAATQTGGGGGQMAIGRPSLKRPFGVEVTSLVLAPEDGLPSHVAAVFVTDPDRMVEQADAFVARVYGLTPAEASLAIHLAAGSSLQEAADHRGVSCATARIQLKRVFKKTGTRGQSDLIRHLLKGPLCAAEDRSPCQ